MMAAVLQQAADHGEAERAEERESKQKLVPVS